MVFDSEGRVEKYRKPSTVACPGMSKPVLSEAILQFRAKGVRYILPHGAERETKKHFAYGVPPFLFRQINALRPFEFHGRRPRDSPILICRHLISRLQDVEFRPRQNLESLLDNSTDRNYRTL